MLFTIGYEGASLSDFVATLRASEIDVVVDIRDRPQSRRPGFSKRVLSETLIAAGIAYEHLGDLGDPKPGRDAARAGDIQTFRQIYGTVLQSAQGRAALAILMDLTAEQNVCLLCYERSPHECHRRIVAQAVERSTKERAVDLGVRSIEQIASATGRVPHPSKSASTPQ